MQRVLLVLACCVIFVCGKKLPLDSASRLELISLASVFLPSSNISSLDPRTGMLNPYNIELFQMLSCTFVEPNCSDPQGGGTPKFLCSIELPSGKVVSLKIKYDQQYNPLVPLWPLGEPNNEVYATPIIERLMWLIGLGTDIAIPVSINCKNCPIEPWTYVRLACGVHWYDVYRYDASLLLFDRWKTKVENLFLLSALAYVNWADAEPALTVVDEETGLHGWAWEELKQMSSPVSQSVERDALTIFAALISHGDNKQVNQGLNCLTSKWVPSKTSRHCAPYLYLHDVGCTLGYGVNLMEGYLHPNVLDVDKWTELSIWSDTSSCEVRVNGLLTASWRSTWKVSDEGRQLLASRLEQISDAQLEAIFSVARVHLYKNQSVGAWVSGWKAKVQRDIFNTRCQ